MWENFESNLPVWYTYVRLLDTYTHINRTWLHTNRYVVEWAIKEFWGFEATLFLHIDL